MTVHCLSTARTGSRTAVVCTWMRCEVVNRFAANAAAAAQIGPGNTNCWWNCADVSTHCG